MDGERGRKKVSTELYWDLSSLSAKPWPPSHPLPKQQSLLTTQISKVLFVTLRDILDTLLPAKDRDHVGSVPTQSSSSNSFANASWTFLPSPTGSP